MAEPLAKPALHDAMARVLGDGPIVDALAHGIAEQLERLHLIAYGDGTDSMPPWAALTDPRVAPIWALPHAAMWCGGELPPRRPGESDEDYHARAQYTIVYPRGMRRGSIGVLRRAVEETLTGTRTVIVHERAAGDLHAVVVQTYDHETPDPAATAEAAASAPIDASLVVTHQVITGQTWAQLGAGGATWSDAANKYGTWGNAGTDTPVTP